MDLARSIEGATDFLLDARDERGWWRDFDTLAGASDEWVTAFVGTALAVAGDDRSMRAAWQAWRLLSRRRWWSAGWGYNARVPADADTTLWALSLAEAVGTSRSVRARRGYSFLRGHVRASGGLATFRFAGPIREFTRLTSRTTFEGWSGEHVCVTAAAANLTNLRELHHLHAFLRAGQDADGHWSGYWWCDPEYTTFLAASALSNGGDVGDRARVGRAVDWTRGRLLRTGSAGPTRQSNESPFAAAWSLRTLALAQDPRSVADDVTSLTDWLTERQARDGSWSPSARLRIPPPDEVDPEAYTVWKVGGKGGGSIVLDRQALFTTASVLVALVTARDRRAAAG